MRFTFPPVVLAPETLFPDAWFSAIVNVFSSVTVTTYTPSKFVVPDRITILLVDSPWLAAMTVNVVPEREHDVISVDVLVQKFAGLVPSPVREMSFTQFAFTDERLGMTATVIFWELEPTVTLAPLAMLVAGPSSFTETSKIET